MSSNSNNFTPLPGAWRTGVRTNYTQTPNNSGYDEEPFFYQSHSFQAIPDDRVSGVLGPPRLMEDRTPTEFNSIFNFAAQPQRRQRVHVLAEDIGRGFNPRLREVVLQSPPRSTRQTNTQVSTAVEKSRSAALSKLKKEVYDPTPKPLARRVSLCYKDSVVNALKEWEKEKQEGGKRCAVCLEDFEPKEEVMLTPCRHLFHEDCIVPWVTSQGKCPVCRFLICEKVREDPSSFNNNSSNIANMAPSDLLIAGELLSIFRAMQEAIPLGNGTY